MKKLFIITGEYSGDKHASDIVRVLKRLAPEVEIEAIGGENLKKEGVKLYSDQSKMSAVGISPQIIIDHLNLEKNLIAHLREFNPDAVLHVDYGGFNLRMAKAIKTELKDLNIKTFYFIPPQIWASRKWRIKAVQKYIDRVFCIFPFEKTMYDDYDIECVYAGHPLITQLPRGASKEEFFTKYNLDKDKKLVSIFPGSRVFEVKNLLKIFVKAAGIIGNKIPDTQFVIALAPNLKVEVIQKFLPKNCNIKIIHNENYPLLELSDSLILASGTVALEAALYNTPMLISYKGPWILYLIYLLVRCIKMVSLPNIIMNKIIIQELIQKRATATDVATETIKILTNKQYSEEMISNLKDVQSHLSDKIPSSIVAENIYSEIIK